MRKSATRFGAGLLAAMLLLSGCAGDGRKTANTGSKGTVEVSKPNEFPIVEEPYELAIFMQKPTGIENLETNTFTKTYEEKTNVKVKWDLISGDVRQAINIKLASDDYSDVFLGFGFAASEQSAYYDQGVFIELSDVVNEHGYYIKKMFEEHPDAEKALRHTKDMLLGLSSVSQGYEGQAPYKMWVYKPWMDKLGLKMPETTEDFYQILKAFKEQDPNGNGKADEVPLAARNNRGGEIGLDMFIMNCFLPWGKFGFNNIDGKAVFAPIQDEAREGIRYMRKLYEEGLIHTDSFVMDRARVTALGENETPILGAATGRWTTQFTAAGTSERMNEFVAIPPLKGSTGHRATPSSTGYGGTTSFSITTDCEDPAVALKWVDWFYSDEAWWAKATPGYRPAKEGEIGTDGTQAVVAIEPSDETFDGIQNTRWNFVPGYSDMDKAVKVKDYTIDATRRQHSYEAYKLYEPYHLNDVVIWDFPMPSEVAEEYLEFRATFVNAIDAGMVGFIIGEKDIDTEWDAYVQNFYDLGLERYTEIVQNWIDTLD
ncbi:MAG: extracellular solute-binding protein [Clostridia bacterium]|nr:extracellular solute-binding protein [Clostridia bacterium]